LAAASNHFRYSSPITALSTAQLELGTQDPIRAFIPDNTLRVRGEAIAGRTPTPAANHSTTIPLATKPYSEYGETNDGIKPKNAQVASVESSAHDELSVEEMLLVPRV
jgi:hypothetical protein